MKTKDVTQVLKSLGWSIRTDEVGDKVAYYKLPDRTVCTIYGIRNFSDDQQLDGTLSLSTDAFSKACFTIRDRGSRYADLATLWNGWKISAPEITEAHVHQASEACITWAKAQDLNAALQEKIALPTSAPGTAPVLHLGALVVAGDIEKLKSYQASFAAGDRLGFAPYITRDYIDRAVALAEEYRDS